MVEAQQGPRVGALLADRFRVLEVIGRGGMGIVIRAFDTFAKTEVAVKHVRPDLAEDPDYADRLLREAYEQAREYMMRGGALPVEPAGVLGQAGASTPVPASPEAVRRAECEVAAMFGQRTAEPGNDDELPAQGKMAAAGLDR